MIMRQIRCFCAAVLFASMFAGVATNARAAKTDASLRDGEWETTVEMKMEGVPFAIPPVTSTQCITKDDPVPKEKDRENKCKTKNQKAVGDKVTWLVECNDDGTRTESRGEITYTGDNYSGTMNTKIFDSAGKVTLSTATLSGRRLGACTDKKKQTTKVEGREVDTAEIQAQQAEQQKQQKARNARSDEFAKLTVPQVGDKACELAGKGFSDSEDCVKKAGKLSLEPGQWEITTEQATKNPPATAQYLGEYAVSDSDDSKTSTQCLTLQSMVPEVKETGTHAEIQDKKRSADKVVWKIRKADHDELMEERGGIQYKGNTLEGVIITTKTQPGFQTELRTRITGKRIGDGNCLAENRDYTSQDRDYTSKSREKKSSDDGVSNTVNKLKGLFGR